MSDLDCFYFRGASLLPDGTELQWHLKAWQHTGRGGRVVLWELPSILDPLGVVEGTKRHPSKWFQERVPKLRPYWESFGIVEGEAFVPSIKSQVEEARRSGATLALHPLSHQEFAVSTRAFVVTLLAVDNIVRRVGPRDNARCGLLLAEGVTRRLVSSRCLSSGRRSDCRPLPLVLRRRPLLSLALGLGGCSLCR